MTTSLNCCNLVFAEKPREVRLPPQSLSSSLIELGKERDISIVFSSELVEGIKAPSVEGTLSTQQAIKKLLKGTNLEPHTSKHGVITLHDDTPEPAEQPKHIRFIEEMSVIGRQLTGSRLSRMDIEGSSLVDTIRAPEITETGIQAVGELLKFLPAVSGNSTSTAIGNGGNGTATVTLRGLPSSNTLVLINGKRVANNGYAGKSVDLNTIPANLVENIDILKSGGSAIYGSDAIAGVVNIQLKTDFDGLRFDQYLGETGQSDLTTSSSSLIWGHNSDSGNVTVHLSYFKQDPLFSRDRDLSASADGRPQRGADDRVSATNPGRITLSSGETVSWSSQEMSYQTASDEQLFNFNDYTSSQASSERYTAYIAGHYQFSNGVHLSTDLAFASTDSLTTLAPSPIYTAFNAIDLTVSANNIYNPFGEDIADLRYRLIEAGPRTKRDDSQTYRYSIDLDGDLDQARWTLSWNISQSNASETQDGVLNAFRVQQALGDSALCLNASDGCVPLDLFSQSIDQAQLDYVVAQTQARGYTRLSELTATIEQDFSVTPAGTATILAGVSLRKESTSLKPSEQSRAMLIVGGGQFGNSRGEREVAEGFFELYLPLIKDRRFIQQLNLEIAARYSSYSDFGQNTTPKIGLAYRPNSSLLFRASYTEGFRAPSLQELYKSQEQSYLNLTDPCSIAGNAEALPGCSGQSDPSLNQFLTINTGNPNLQAEIAETKTIGLLWSPDAAPGLKLGLDFYTISQDQVVGASGQFIINQNAQFARFSHLVTRDSNANIQRLHAPNLNIGHRRVSGLDLQFSQRWQTKQWGNFKLSVNASNIRTYLYQTNPSQAPENLAGTFSDEASEGNGALPKWKVSSGLGWQKQKWKLRYNIYYVDSLVEVSQINSQRSVDDWASHNLQINYKASKNTSVSVGIDNLWDTEPPFLDSAFNDNYDARTYDIKGRYWYTRFNYNFM